MRGHEARARLWVGNGKEGFGFGLAAHLQEGVAVHALAARQRAHAQHAHAAVQPALGTVGAPQHRAARADDDRVGRVCRGEHLCD